ncbi:MAG: TolC family protein [Deltaproteobacteria bacterium]|nr:TolC family protein [Deltaproteobacteria bacterium]
MIFNVNHDEPAKSSKAAISAKEACPGMIEAGGIHNYLKRLDSGIKFRNDRQGNASFCGIVNTAEHPKSPRDVIPAQAGIHKRLETEDSAIKAHPCMTEIGGVCNFLKTLDSGIKFRNDRQGNASFCGTCNTVEQNKSTNAVIPRLVENPDAVIGDRGIQYFQVLMDSRLRGNDVSANGAHPGMTETGGIHRRMKPNLIGLFTAVIITLSALSLSGCAPDFVKMRDTHSQEFSSALLEKSERYIPSEGPLSLETCIDIALENNLDILLADINSRLARIDKNAAFGYFLPQIEVSVTRLDHDKQQMQMIGGGAPIAASDKQITQKVISGQMALFYPSTWFIYNSFKKGADIQSLLSERVRQAIRLQITALYLSCLSQEASEKAVEASVDQAEALFKEVEALFREGLVLKSDLENARTFLVSQENRLRDNARLKAETKAQLMEALGLSPLAGISLKGPPSLTTVEEELSDQILTAMLNRLEMKIADRNVSIKKDAVRIAIADFLPMIGIFGDYTNSSNSFQFYENILSYGITGVLALFDGFRDVQDYRAAKQEHMKAMIEREQSCMKIMMEVIKARDFLEQTKDAGMLARMEMEASAANLKEVQALWREGMATSSEKLDAAGRYAAAEANVSLADYSYQVALATMNDVMGI